MEKWHSEHFDDLVGCPGKGGNLCLRYRNLIAYDAYENPKLEERVGQSPEESRKAIADFDWKYLSLVNIEDLSWVKSTPFLSLPFTSKVLPRKEDGSWGNIWDACWAALRTYQTVDKVKREGAEGRPRYMVSLQLDTFGDENMKALEEVYGKREGWRSTTKFKLAPGLMMYPEPGNIPEGFLVFEFDEKPTVAEGEELKGAKTVRQDAWELFVERGDLTLDL